MFWWFYWTGLAARCADIANASQAGRGRRPRPDGLRPRPVVRGPRLATRDGIRVENERA